jgi:probable phosphoglycerate mutase
MNAPLQVYVIRHCETAWSLSGQHTGRTDLPLTPRGAAMARELARALAGVTFSRVLTSPRLRARDTCELAGLGGSGDGRARTEADLAEWDYGDFEGLRTTEIRQRYPDWDLWKDGCPGGETPTDASRRADQLIARLQDLTGTVALFSHGHFGRVLAARWIGLPVAQGKHFALDLASISILGVDTGHSQTRVISLWNSTARCSLPAA